MSTNYSIFTFSFTLHYDFFLFSTLPSFFFFFFFLNDPAPPEISPLPLHDALPISAGGEECDALRRGPGPAERSDERADLVAPPWGRQRRCRTVRVDRRDRDVTLRSEEHTSELQSPCNLVCRLLLEKKKKNTTIISQHRNQSTRLILLKSRVRTLVSLV